ncbi:hypothetical protein TRIATDRAFT_284027 [Trichoderma atroviride IMI 206040]|uniref:Uncharacterized protein n=1 Tax=Hypocrea atroviridis (strain ATCC 20476 / IMI 206040) TaxID=452589 RepID=G9NVK2_HYPAI|nr:uncharacterized protein TRIATDRAFT_284027 [Trichoderma atroviride IMI 206040]EHK45021.1 hypothetical protein TRIATDRAFT_284027 [Trichoderma atroviride IMI 206040]
MPTLIGSAVWDDSWEGIQGSGGFSPQGSHNEAAMPQIPNDMDIQLHQQLLPKAVKLAALEHWQCVSEPKHGWAIKERYTVLPALRQTC